MMHSNILKTVSIYFQDEKVSQDLQRLLTKIFATISLIVTLGLINLQLNESAQRYDFAILGSCAFLIGNLLIAPFSNVLRHLAIALVIYILSLPISYLIFAEVYSMGFMHHGLDLLIGGIIIGVFGIVVPVIWKWGK